MSEVDFWSWVRLLIVIAANISVGFFALWITALVIEAVTDVWRYLRRRAALLQSQRAEGAKEERAEIVKFGCKPSLTRPTA